MKAGTAQKIALNCFSTAVMIRLNRVHAGQMVDMRLSNEKLRARAEAMVARIAGVRPELAADALVRADGRIKPAVLVAKGLDPADAVELLDRVAGNLRTALGGAQARQKDG
jgi:N-acetylmuramic acid 6-phosphate etherase